MRSRRKEPGPEKTPRIGLRVEEPRWRQTDLPLLRRAARAALADARVTGELTVLLAGDARLRDLNEKYRGKPKATNVLSFPGASRSDGYLGDIAMAFGVVEREAAAARKSVSHHAAHLVVHGVLHLLGYDHMSAPDARIMESLEVVVLKRLGIGDPYALPEGFE